MEYASNEIQNMEYEHEKGNTGHGSMTISYTKMGISFNMGPQKLPNFAGLLSE